MKGYFRIYREQFRDLCKNREALQVWAFLCEQARFRETTRDHIEILPGQVILSGSEIAHACDLSVNRVQYILRFLEQKGLITRTNIRNRYSLITVLAPEEADTQAAQTGRPGAAAKKITPSPTEPTTEVQAAMPAADEKACCGLFGNVLLSAEEKRILHTRSNAADDYIDKLSAYKYREKKEYKNDFSVLCEWISKDNIDAKRRADSLAASMQHHPGEQPQKEKMPVIPPLNQHGLPDIVSYDLALAERMAREHVPILQKRPKKAKTQHL